MIESSSAPAPSVCPTAVPLAPTSRPAVFVAVVRRSAPRLIEASLIPTALFYWFLVLMGTGAAYAAAIIWLYAAVAHRWVRRRPVSPLLLLGALGITVRTTVAVASGSAFIYFAQPILGSVVVGGAFLVSIAVGRPIVEALAMDFWPLTPEMRAHPAVRRLLRRLTYLWGGINLAIAATTFALLIALPLPAFVALKQVVVWVISGAGVAITIDRAIRTARRAGFVANPVVAPVLAASG